MKNRIFIQINQGEPLPILEANEGSSVNLVTLSKLTSTEELLSMLERGGKDYAIVITDNSGNQVKIFDIPYNDKLPDVEGWIQKVINYYKKTIHAS